MITRISKQGGRRYPQFGSTSMGKVTLFPSVGSGGAATITITFKKTLSMLGTKAGSRQVVWRS